MGLSPCTDDKAGLKGTRGLFFQPGYLCRRLRKNAEVPHGPVNDVCVSLGTHAYARRRFGHGRSAKSAGR
jgi:hypothetical protein